MPPRCLTVALVFITILLAACRAETHPRGPAPDVESPPFIPSAHPPGTLLRDSRGRLWMSETWPHRAPVPSEEAYRAHLARDQAILMAFNEELCLTPGAGVWRRHPGWRLFRLPDGVGWYVDRDHHYRRLARPPVIAANRESLADAPAWDETPERLVSEYRDFGPMPLPDGALIRTEGQLWYYYDGSAHPFASEELARNAGYDPRAAIPLPDGELGAYAEDGTPLTAQTFMLCPASIPDTRRYEDEDADGSLRSEDCDDHDSRRGRGHVEICDGLDNNCDGVIDDGFSVGLPCTLDDGCESPGLTQCAYDGWTVTCDNQEAICDR